MVRCDRYMILAFTRFRLDAINLNNARSVSSNQNSYLSVTKLHKISRKNISSLMLAFSVCCVFSLPGSGLKPQKGHEKVLACTPPPQWKDAFKFENNGSYRRVYRVGVSCRTITRDLVVLPGPF